MNIKTKTVIASVFLTALFAGTSAFAGDNDRFPEATFATTTDAVVMKKVNYVIDEVKTVKKEKRFISGRKSERFISSRKMIKVNYVTPSVDTDDETGYIFEDSNR